MLNLITKFTQWIGLALVKTGLSMEVLITRGTLSVTSCLYVEWIKSFMMFGGICFTTLFLFSNIGSTVKSLAYVMMKSVVLGYVACLITPFLIHEGWKQLKTGSMTSMILSIYDGKSTVVCHKTDIVEHPKMIKIWTAMHRVQNFYIEAQNYMKRKEDPKFGGGFKSKMMDIFSILKSKMTDIFSIQNLSILFNPLNPLYFLDVLGRPVGDRDWCGPTPGDREKECMGFKCCSWQNPFILLGPMLKEGSKESYSEEYMSMINNGPITNRSSHIYSQTRKQWIPVYSETRKQWVEQFCQQMQNLMTSVVNKYNLSKTSSVIRVSEISSETCDAPNNSNNTSYNRTLNNSNNTSYNRTLNSSNTTTSTILWWSLETGTIPFHDNIR